MAAGTLLAGALAKASERVARATDGLAIIAGQANSSTLETALNRTGNTGPITFHVTNSTGGALLAECTGGICGDFSNSAGGGAVRAVCASGGVPITGGFTFGSTPTNPAVLGSNPGPGPGVQGGTTSGTGVLGQAGSGVGVQGTSTSNVGVLGTSTSSVGVYAQSSSSTGLYATSASGAGIVASTNGGNAIQGASNGNVGVLGTSNSSIGVFAASGTSTGLYATGPASGFAARFDGPVLVNGNFTAIGGSKSAAVPHPDGSHRRLYCVESPESWFEDFGRDRIANGRGRVRLDPDFAALVHGDDYYVFLTPQGDSNGLYVSNQGPNAFEVRERNGGTSSHPFSYRVVAKRKDIPGARLEKVDIPATPARPTTATAPTLPPAVPPPHADGVALPRG